MPITRASSEPRLDLDVVRRLLAGAPPGGAGPLSSSRSGRCWTSVPPRATFSACAPRQIASSGSSRRQAIRASASSKRSTSSSVGPELGMALLRRSSPGRGRARPRGRRRSGARAAARARRRRAAAARPAGRRPPRSRAGTSARAPSRPAAARPAASDGPLSLRRTSDVVTPISGRGVAAPPQASTQVAFPPPFWLEFTTSAPGVERHAREPAREHAARRCRRRERERAQVDVARLERAAGDGRMRREHHGLLRDVALGLARGSARAARARSSSCACAQTTTPSPP